jgi:hypothetical protein
MDQMVITVEKDVPIPRSMRGAKYPFATLEVGDSFTMPANMKQLLRSHALAYKRANPGWDYKTISIPDGVRLWRVA